MTFSGALSRLAFGAAILSFSASCFLLLPSIPATAQEAAGRELQSLINRVDRLQRELNTLQAQVYRGRGAPASAVNGAPGAPGADAGTVIPPNQVAAMQGRLDDLDSQIRTLTGQLEEVGHRVGQVSSRLDKLVADIDFRLSTLESRLPAADADASGGSDGAAATPPGETADLRGNGPQSGTGTGTGTGVLGTLTREEMERFSSAETPGGPTGSGTTGEAPPMPEGSPEERYKYATSLLAREDYAAAERAFRAFLDSHPDHSLAGNAQYWLGETFYVRGSFGEAARAFGEGYRKYPRSEKSPDNLLKLAMSLRELGQASQACTTLDRLRSEFSTVRAGIRDTAARQRRELDCP